MNIYFDRRILTPCRAVVRYVAFTTSVLGLVLLSTKAGAEVTSLSGATEITALPWVISQPGTYFLKQNLQSNISSGNAIDIQASDVLLDLNGHALTNGTASPASTVNAVDAVDRSNITVRNGAIVGFHMAVNIASSAPFDSTLSSGHLIEDIHATRCNFAGVVIYGGNSTIRRCRLYKIGGNSVRNDIWPTGVAVLGTNQRVLDCDIGEITGNAWGGGGTGILCYNTADGFLEGNRVGQVTHAITHIGWSTFKYRDNLTGFGMAIPYYVGSGAVDAGGNN